MIVLFGSFCKSKSNEDFDNKVFEVKDCWEEVKMIYL